MGVVLIVARGRPHPLALSNSSVWEGEVPNREEGEMAWKSREEGDLPSCTSPSCLMFQNPFHIALCLLKKQSGNFGCDQKCRDHAIYNHLKSLSFRTWNIDCVLNTQSNPLPPSHWSFSNGEILTEFISWYLPSNKPHQDLGDQRKVGRTKVLHRYESGITQGSHHFGKIYEKKRRGFSLNLGPLP